MAQAQTSFLWSIVQPVTARMILKNCRGSNFCPLQNYFPERGILRSVAEILDGIATEPSKILIIITSYHHHLRQILADLSGQNS